MSVYTGLVNDAICGTFVCIVALFNPYRMWVIISTVFFSGSLHIVKRFVILSHNRIIGINAYINSVRQVVHSFIQVHSSYHTRNRGHWWNRFSFVLWYILRAKRWKVWSVTMLRLVVIFKFIVIFFHLNTLP